MSVISYQLNQRYLHYQTDFIGVYIVSTTPLSHMIFGMRISIGIHLKPFSKGIQKLRIVLFQYNIQNYTSELTEYIGTEIAVLPDHWALFFTAIN